AAVLRARTVMATRPRPDRAFESAAACLSKKLKLVVVEPVGRAERPRSGRDERRWASGQAATTSLQRLRERYCGLSNCPPARPCPQAKALEPCEAMRASCIELVFFGSFGG